MIYRELFTETPYAAALSTANLSIRCSSCFAAGATVACSDDGCQRVVYCNEQCRQLDKPYHTNECMAFRKNKDARISEFNRLVARSLTRRKLDRGIVHLCENFPENVPDRYLDDLMSHQDDIVRSSRVSDLIRELDRFREAFSCTSLVDDWDLVKKMYCQMTTNCFSVSGTLDMISGIQPSIGTALYINVSRFNHSCRADLNAYFDNARMIVQYLSSAIDEQAAVHEKLAMTQSTEKFNQLTVSYGFSNDYSGGHFPLRHQRRDWLEFGYFFQCHCVLCDDERAAAFEVNAAAIECADCGEPYLWTRKAIAPRPVTCWGAKSRKEKITCQKSCNCVSTKKEMARVKAYVEKCNRRKKDWYSCLEQEWSDKTLLQMKHFYSNEIIEMCEPLWRKAQPIWHSTTNLRMNHLQERLFVSYEVQIFNEWKRKEVIDPVALEKALLMGEAALAWYKWNDRMMYFDTAIAPLSFKLARLYEIAAKKAESTKNAADYWSRSVTRYKDAARVWMAYREHATDLVKTLLDNAQEAQKAADALQSEMR